MTSTHVQPELGQEDMSREFCLSFANIVKYMQVRHSATPRAPPPVLRLIRVRTKGCPVWNLQITIPFCLVLTLKPYRRPSRSEHYCRPASRCSRLCREVMQLSH